LDAIDEPLDLGNSCSIHLSYNPVLSRRPSVEAHGRGASSLPGATTAMACREYTTPGHSVGVGFFASPETQYQVTPFQDLRTELNDTDVDDPDGSGLPFGPGDFTGAYQFSLSIPASDSASVTTGLYVDSPFFASGFDNGSTEGWAGTTP